MASSSSHCQEYQDSLTTLLLKYHPYKRPIRPCKECLIFLKKGLHLLWGILICINHQTVLLVGVWLGCESVCTISLLISLVKLLLHYRAYLFFLPSSSLHPLQQHLPLVVNGSTPLTWLVSADVHPEGNISLGKLSKLFPHTNSQILVDSILKLCI